MFDWLTKRGAVRMREEEAATLAAMYDEDEDEPTLRRCPNCGAESYEICDQCEGCEYCCTCDPVE